MAALTAATAPAAAPTPARSRMPSRERTTPVARRTSQSAFAAGPWALSPGIPPGGWVGAVASMLTGSPRGRSHRPGDAAVFAHAPEMNGHEQGGDERDEDAVQHVEAQQGGRADQGAAEQGIADVGGDRH